MDGYWTKSQFQTSQTSGVGTPSPPGFEEGGKMPAVSIGRATPNGTPAASQCCSVSASGSRAACSSPAKSVASIDDG
eukprot:11914997-Heterocapsa_arctica.AAC.1